MDPKHLLIGKVITELRIRNSATKFFNFLLHQLHNSQNICEKVHETTVLQGDWQGIGSVKSWTFTTEGKVETGKKSIEAIDEEKKSMTFNFFDGEIGMNYKILKITVQVVDDEKDAGGVAKWTMEYEKQNEDIAPPYRYLDIITAFTKDVDAFVLKADN